ncbi:hypothetical protein [Halorubrum salsamenti]|nr:hypothetical protein [Halorubrum salsamenti]
MTNRYLPLLSGGVACRTGELRTTEAARGASPETDPEVSRR